MINNKLLKSAAAAGGGLVPSQNFTPVIYTGNGATTQTITGLGFKPDFVWIKQRSGSASHSLQDIVRGDGASKTLSSDDTAAQGAYGGFGFLNSFDDDGFTVNLGSSTGAAHTNKLNTTYVAWCWTASDAFSHSASGSQLASTGKSNQAAGFSIVSYTGNDTSGATVKHNLGVKPELIIFKALGVNNNWGVYASAITADKFLVLNTTAQAVDSTTPFNDTEPDATIFTLGDSGSFNRSDSPGMIAYCFASILGYSKVGSYTGTQANQHIDCGFEPAWVMIKNTENTYRWYILDNKRNPTNPKFARLFANAGTTEATNSNILNFTTTGFQIITSDAEVNQSNKKMIFLAFAADPDTTTPTLTKSFNVDTYTGNGATQQIGSVNTLFTKFGIFNGSSSVITLPTLGLSPTTDLSISLWIKGGAQGNAENTIISLWDDLNLDIRVDNYAPSANRIMVVYRTTGFVAKNSNFTMTVGTWEHFVLTYDPGTGFVVYKNGVSSGAISESATIGTATGTNKIGAYGGGNSGYFKGSIDQVRIYNTVINQAAVTELYNETQASASTLNFPAGLGGRALYEFNNDATSTDSSSYNGVVSNVTFDSFLFKPDLVIIKNRSFSGGSSWSWADTLRGVSNDLRSDTNNSNRKDLGFRVTEFNNAGFSVTDVANGDYGVNGTPAGQYTGNGDYVAYSFKMLDNNNNSAVENEVGQIDSLVSANPSAGMSIVRHTSTNNNNTIGHGLSSAPQLIISKNLDLNTDWGVYSSATGLGKYMYLNKSDAVNASADSNVYPAVSATTFAPGTSGWNNGTGKNYIHYCFHSVSGFSKFGSYTGTGSTGNIIYTTDNGQSGGANGFQPDFLMVKAITESEPWFVLDSARNTSNPRNNRLMFDSSSAEDGGGVHTVDFNSNNFTLDGTVGNGTNGNDKTYIYWAMKIN